jgi:HEAT repeat protein
MALTKRKLDRLARRGDVAKLREILDDQDRRRSSDGTIVDVNWQGRVGAVSALAQIDHADAETALVAVLTDSVRPVRHAAVDALAARKSPSALPRLAYVCATWADARDQARLAGLRALQETSGASAAVSYVQGLVSTDSQFPPDDLDEALIRGFVETNTSADLADDLADFLVAQLASEDAERASRAEIILGWLGGTGVKAAEEAALKIDGAAGGAARVLGQIGEESSIPTLREVLEQGANAEDRRAAAVALTELRTPLAIEPLVIATRDADRTVRDAALAGLDTYGTMATVAMIGGVIRPGTDAVRELSRPHQNPLSLEAPEPAEPPQPAEARQPDGWRGKVLARLQRSLDGPE